jgi:hypothetical protein
MAINFNVPAVRSSSITFTLKPLVLCEFLQLVFFFFFHSFDLLNSGITQQIGYSNQPTSPTLPRSNG